MSWCDNIDNLLGIVGLLDPAEKFLDDVQWTDEI